MTYFIKFSYKGWRFTGFQRGNGANSVEDTIGKLLSLEHISDFKTAARTDRGVSAVSNVMSVEYEGNIRKLMNSLNQHGSGIVFHSFCQVDDGRNVRHCAEKIYRYIVIGQDKDRIERRVLHFQGTHDFSRFSRADSRNPVRTISKIEVRFQSPYVFVDFHGRSFVWNQIRRIMGSVLFSDDFPDDPFSGELRIYNAPSENLILLDILYSDTVFTPFKSRAMRQNIVSGLTRSAIESQLYQSLLELGS